jgi:hypothetical protein
VGALKVSCTVDVKLLTKYEFIYNTRSPPVDSSPKPPAEKKSNDYQLKQMMDEISRGRTDKI